MGQGSLDLWLSMFGIPGWFCRKESFIRKLENFSPRGQDGNPFVAGGILPWSQ